MRCERSWTTILLIIVLLLSHTIPPAGANATKTSSQKHINIKNLQDNSEEKLKFVLKSEDMIVSGNERVGRVETSQTLKGGRNTIEEYYINKSITNPVLFTKNDFPIQVKRLSDYENENYQGLNIGKFGWNILYIDSNEDGNLDANEPIFKDIVEDFKLSNSDRLVKNGTVEMKSMTESNTTYFNVREGAQSYQKGLAIISYETKNQLHQGPLNKRPTKLSIRGEAPITGFDETSGQNFIFKLNDSDELLNPKPAIIKTNLSEVIGAGGLNNGETKIVKSGKGNMESFEENEKYHIDAVNPLNNSFNNNEVIINDTKTGERGAIDETDKVSKSGKGFVSLLKDNISTYGSGGILIGDSDGDEEFGNGEFIYAESGGSKGYQYGEDLVIVNNTSSNLSSSEGSSGSYVKLNDSKETNIGFLDLNNNGYLDIQNGNGIQNGSEPLVKIKPKSLDSGSDLTPNSDFVKAATESDAPKTIEGNWLSEANYIDLYSTTGPANDGPLRYIQPNNDGDVYRGNEVIVEDNGVDNTLDQDDIVIVGANIENTSARKIPTKTHFLDLDHTGKYNDSYPILSLESGGSDQILNGKDEIVYPGKQIHFNKFSKNIEYIDQDGTKSYTNAEPIIKSQNHNDDYIEFQDEIMNSDTYPANFDTSLLGDYSGDVLDSRPYYLTKDNSENFARGDPVANIKLINSSKKSINLETRVLADFDDQTMYIDNNLDDHLSDNEIIFREKDTNSVSANTFGDRLTTVTVTTNGSLTDEHIDSIQLSNGTDTIATATDPTPNGTWILRPDPDAAWFGPEGQGTTFSLQMTVAADAPGGQSVALEIPPINDSDGDGTYDPGETGVFLEQGEPIGDIGPGPALTVQRNSEAADDTPTPLSLSVALPSSNLSGSAESIPITVSGNQSDRSVVASLRDLETETTVAQKSATLDATGQANVAFEATPGQYRVQVKAQNGQAAVLSQTLRVEPSRNVTISARTKSLERGERGRFTIDMKQPTSVTVRLEGPDGELLEKRELVPNNASPPYDIGIETGDKFGDPVGDKYSLESPTSSVRSPKWFTGLGNGRQRNRSLEKKTSNGNPSAAGTRGTKNGSGVEIAGGSVASNESSVNRAGKGSSRLSAGTYRVSVETIDNSTASTAFELTAPWSVDMTPFVAPRDVTLDNASEVKAQVSKRDTIAAGDTLVVAVNTSGLEAFDEEISVAGPPPHAAGKPGKGRKRPPNKSSATPAQQGSPPAFVSVGPASGRAVGKNETPPKRINSSDSEVFYVVRRTNRPEIGPGTALESEMVLTEATPFVSPVANRTARESKNATLAVVEPSAEFQGLSPNGTLDFPPQEAVPITGSTNLAPGTKATIHVEGENESFDLERSMTVEEDGSYQTTANFSDYESGSSYTVSVTADGEPIGELRSGSFIGTDSKTAAAAGGGGWTGGSSSRSTDRSETEETATTVNPTTSSGPLPEPVSKFPGQAVDRVWEPLPEPIRLGLTALLLLGLGTLAVIAVGVGIKRLLVT